MNFEYVDNIYRSRLTLLNILEERGFNVDKYRKFSPAEIFVAKEAYAGLSFTVNKRDDEEYRCEVMYTHSTRQRLETLLLNQGTEEAPLANQGPEASRPKDSRSKDSRPKVVRPNEYIFMLTDAVTDVHHQLALKAYMLNNKLRVSFFSVHSLVFDPRQHILVPHQELVPESEHAAIMESWNITSKAQMPMIRYHVDPIVRILGGVPGDILKIIRPSPSAGTYEFYRVISP
jgi:DNA-directed RNA polymerase subunit H